MTAAQGEKRMGKRRLFCEYGPAFYKISLAKERLRRDVKDAVSGLRFATRQSEERLPVIVKSHRSVLLRQLEGVDMGLQENKAHNLRLAAAGVHGLILRPGEVFSFWKRVGDTTREKGYKEGLVLMSGRLGSEVGGGICQLSNLLHWLVLHSPLTVTELHHHTDAIFPDSGRRVPFGTGTSVFYNNVDYRFKNTTSQPVQLLVWVDETHLNGELRAMQPFPLRYRIEEEDHHFTQEADGYYRNSRIYRRQIRRDTGEDVERELLLHNHSRVLYDPAAIPQELIRHA